MTPATLTFLREHRSAMAPAEIAAALAADFATAGTLDRKALAAYLLAAGLSGSFRVARESADTPEPIREALLLLQDIVTSGIDYVETNRPEFGAQMAQLLGGLQAAGLVDAGNVAALIGLAGGYRYDRLSEAEIVVEFAAEVAEAALIALRQRAAAGYNGVVAAIDGGETDHAQLAKVFQTGLEG
jgi:hypothetical protein